MTVDLGNFDATTVEPSEAFEIIPPGEYRAAIIKSEAKPTKKGDGHYVEFTVELLDEPHKGRRVFGWRLNLDNPNPKAVEIARRELSAICHAVGKLQVASTSDLENIPFRVKIAVSRDDRGNARNEVKGPVLPKKGETAAAPSNYAAPVNSTAADSTPPWAR